MDFTADTEKVLSETLSNFTRPKFEIMIAERSSAIAKSLPSCKIIHSLYERLVLTGCLQYVDNFNTYWVTLLFLVVLHFVIACLSINQADLYRKSFPYHELLHDTEPTDGYKEYSPSRDQIYHTKAGVHKSENPVIDAYEMHGYTKNNPNLHKSRATPPPNYKVTRA